MRVGLALGGIALVAVVGGCTSSSKPPSFHGASASSAPPFTEPAAYSYVLTRGCDDAAPLARYRITVRDGDVTKSERLGAGAPAPASTDVDLGPVVVGQDGEEIDAPTLPGLLSMAQTATDDGAAVTTALDNHDGHPVKVTIDVEDGSGPECFTVSDYAPA
jgi:hypothetical protein